MDHLEQIFFRSYLFKMSFLDNLKNLNKFPGKYLIQWRYNVNTHAPIKKKHFRCNQFPFMNKQLREEIMIRNRLLNKCRKDNSARNHFAYKRQRNLCVKLLRKHRKVFYNNLNVKRTTNNRTFLSNYQSKFCIQNSQRWENNLCWRRQSYNRRKRCS